MDVSVDGKTLKSGTADASSGVTTDPADPAMRGARDLWGPKNYGINFFNENFTGQLSCGRAMR